MPNSNAIVFPTPAEIQSDWAPNFAMPAAIADLLEWIAQDYNAQGSGPANSVEIDSRKDTMDYLREEAATPSLAREVDRLGPFLTTGNGSCYAIWNAGNGHFPVVYLDSEGSPFHVIAADAEDFLWLLSMGDSGRRHAAHPQFKKRPAALIDPDDIDQCDSFAMGQIANATFRQWVEARAQQSTPDTAADIVARIEQANLPSFYSWVCALYGWKENPQHKDPRGMSHLDA